MFLLILFFCLVAVYYKLIKPHNYWKQRGVQHIKPWPILGNIGPFALRLTSWPEILHDLYNANVDRRYDGMYQFMQPTLFLRDIELIKQITIKEFDSFSEIGSFVSQANDNLAKKSLVNLTKEGGWQDMRSILSPAFTSSKMKMIYTLMDECAEQFIKFLMLKDDDLITVDVSNLFNKVTNDIIASAAFGVKCDSLKDQNNEFYLQGKKATTRTGLRSLVFVISTLHPILQKLTKVRFINSECEEFFLKLIKETIKYREDNNVIRHDMLHLLMEAKKNRLNHDVEDNVDDGFAAVKESETTINKKVKVNLTLEDIAAQAIIFFIAGFEGSAVTVSQLSYELAVNPDIQKKLQEEIDKTIHNGNGKITYEALLKMKYLDCVVSENLRLKPLAANTTRITTKPFTIEPKLPGETPVHLEKGTHIWIPIYGIHHDPKHYPNPKKFDPERFNEENKHNIKPHSYIPFGGGPRNCIGSRFALLQMKTVIVNLLSNFNIVPVKETIIPMEFEKGSLSMLPKDGLWLGFEKRKF